MTSGIVKFFNATRGFGFIQPDSGGSDIFVHISAVERAGLREIREGQRFSFDIVEDARSGKSSAQNLQAS
ncbi:cold-shock protein [Chelatococcus reniformis]|uniref:Cold-shock protein n=1 Tax=Chelatococcus reniformis TaxID=1494448 RepID=A0A916U4A8_9HYPH|nr:cold-shock protein [Chelatococcus reniformis]GGC60119.1 cold-shock protein [Chelatococcus reniformis]